jgi:serine/threonine-protein kinase
MGVVWRGRDRQTGDPCAIKILRPDLAADPAAVTRFVRERMALTRFRHPNVVPLRDMIVEGESLALVMDLIAGGDLNAYRRSRGDTLPLGEALELIAQTCDALAAAHAAGIVHRDLKPGNILIDAGQVRLADFGIALIVGDAPVTTAGTTIGTISFMAPEVIRGEQPTPACDVYAAGVTLHELLTGAPPFTGHMGTVIRHHLDTVPSQPAGVPDRIWSPISACLSKDPTARPTAAALARVLRDLALRPEPMAAVPSSPSSWNPPSEWIRGDGGFEPTRAPRSADAAFLGQPTPPANTGATDVPTGPGRRGGRRGPQRRTTLALLAVTAALALTAGGTYLATSGSERGTPTASPQPSAQLRAAAASQVPALSGIASNTRSRHPSPSHSPAAGPTAPPSSAAGPSSPGTPTSVPPVASTSPAATPSGVPGPTGPNLVADGDFSESSLSAWNNGVLYTTVVSSGPNGGKAAQMIGQPTAGLNQIVTGLKPGTDYELTGWIISTTGDYTTYIGAKAYDSTAGASRAIDSASSTTWSQVSMTFTPAAGHTSAEIFCWQAVAGTGYCADVTLRALS